MNCFLRHEKDDDMFELFDDILFLNVLNDKNEINLQKYLITVYLLSKQYDSLIVHLNSEFTNMEKIKVVLSKNVAPNLSYAFIA